MVGERGCQDGRTDGRTDDAPDDGGGLVDDVGGRVHEGPEVDHALPLLVVGAVFL